MKQRHLALGFLAAIVIVYFGVLFYVFSSASDQVSASLKEAQLEQQSLVGEGVAASLDTAFDGVRSELALLALIPAIRDGSSGECSQAISSALLEAGVHVSNVTRVNLDGVVDCANTPTALGHDAASFEQVLARALERQSREPQLGRLAFSPSTGRPVIGYYQPLLSSAGEYKGVLAGVVYLDALGEKHLAHAKFLATGFTSLVDNDSAYLHHPSIELVGTPAFSQGEGFSLAESEKAQAALKAAFTGNSSAIELVRGGSMVQSSFTPVEVVPGRTWAVATMVPVEEITGSLSVQSFAFSLQWAQLMGVVAFFALFLAGLYYAYILRFIFEPVEQLTGTIDEVSGGRVDVEVPLGLRNKGDEFGELANAFQRLLVSLKLAIKLTAPELEREKKRLEAELGKSTKLYEDIVKTLDNSALVSMTDLKGDIFYANDKFVEISKYPRGELLDENHRILKSKFGGEDFHTPKFYKGLWDAISKGKVWKGDIRNKAKDGSVYWVRSTLMPAYDEKGAITGYVAVRMPITDVMQKAEEDIAKGRETPEIKRLRDGP